jgi:hypothetical protein
LNYQKQIKKWGKETARRKNLRKLKHDQHRWLSLEPQTTAPAPKAIVKTAPKPFQVKDLIGMFKRPMGKTGT